MSAEEGLAWGFFNGVVAKDELMARAQKMARSLADGPAFAHSMTKKCLHQEWNLSIEQALEVEAEAQAICMQTEDFTRAYKAFVAKERPRFEGN
jgi:enoyl-CoA hydratase/carnithine racemase